MKILFLTENYFPNVSGVPVVVKYLAEGLINKGYYVAVVTQCFEDEPLHDKINGVDVFRFRIYKDFWHRYRGEIKNVVKFVIDYKADVTIFECAQCITTDIFLPYLDKINGMKIFHSHGFSGLEGHFFKLTHSFKHTLGSTYNWFHARLYYGYTFKKAISNFDLTLCLSKVDNSMPYLEKYAKAVKILDNAADNIFFEKLDNTEDVLKKYVQIKNKCYFVSCANYQFIKNQISIINQFYKSSSSRNYSLICIGSQKNDYYKECLKVISSNERKYGHRDVHLLVGVERKDIPSIIHNASLYLVASRCERYSISIIEAMSQGIPFISTNVGNACDLPGGLTLNNISNMHKEIDYLLADESLYSKYSKAGKEFAYKNCRIDAVIDKLDSLLSK